MTDAGIKDNLLSFIGLFEEQENVYKARLAVLCSSAWHLRKVYRDNLVMGSIARRKLHLPLHCLKSLPLSPMTQRQSQNFAMQSDWGVSIKREKKG